MLEDSALRLSAMRSKQYLEAHGRASDPEEVWRLVALTFAGLRTASDCAQRWREIAGNAVPGMPNEDSSDDAE